MEGAGTYTYESVKEKDGVSRHFIINAKPLLDAKGKVVGSVESFQEITARKRAEQALERSNRKLEALSNTDGLTGVANRRRFDQVLAREYARHVRSGAKLSLVMLDIDQFKAFNDCYGHISGDECLQQVARVIMECATRPADLVARYGGEEFACILPETSGRGAVIIAEKIRRGIMALGIPHTGSSVAPCVTASLGVVTVECTADGSAMDILAQVDALLYRAKASGRNRVEFVAAREVGEEIKANLVHLAWQDSFCCGNQLLDMQHQTLLRISNELLDAVLLTRPAPEISAIISRLLAEAAQHFRDEESILEEIGYPGRSHHVEEHTKLLAKGMELSEGFKASTLTMGDVFQFLVYEVVMRHMLEADREFFPFLNGSDAADS
jgi:diguanylate cyclase (GGDEF)-like protein/hemerythrin-like metal-binding protein